MRIVSWLALALWALTIVAIGFMFFKSSTEIGDDGRTVVKLDTAEQTFVLGEMRKFLEAIRDATAALEQDDMKAVAVAVTDKGLVAMMRDTPGSIITKSPADFLLLSTDMHKGFDDIKAAAEKGADRDAILLLMSEQLSRCVACHSSFRMP